MTDYTRRSPKSRESQPLGMLILVLSPSLAGRIQADANQLARESVEQYRAIQVESRSAQRELAQIQQDRLMLARMDPQDSRRDVLARGLDAQDRALRSKLRTLEVTRRGMGTALRKASSSGQITDAAVSQEIAGLLANVGTGLATRMQGIRPDPSTVAASQTVHPEIVAGEGVGAIATEGHLATRASGIASELPASVRQMMRYGGVQGLKWVPQVNTTTIQFVDAQKSGNFQKPGGFDATQRSLAATVPRWMPCREPARGPTDPAALQPEANRSLSPTETW